MTQPVREARSPGSCVHLHPKLIYKVVFPGRTAPVTCGAAKVTGSPFAGPAHWWLRPPQHQKKAASAAESHRRLAAYPQGTAHHPSQPQFPFFSKCTPPLQRQTWHCRVPRFPPYRCSASGHLSPPPGNAGSTRDPPSTAQLGPSGSQHLTFPGAEPWQGEGAAYAEQMESIKTKGSGPASSYYPSKGLKRIYRHPQPHGKGEPAGAREKCPECSDAGARTTGRPFASLCPRGCSAKPSPRGSWGHLPISRSFSALCIAPPACSLGPHRSRATRRLATTMPPGRVAAPADRLPELQVASCFSLGFISWWKR